MQASHAPVVDLDLRSFAKNDTAILGSIKITLSPEYNAAHHDHFHVDMGGFGMCR